MFYNCKLYKQALLSPERERGYSCILVAEARACRSGNGGILTAMDDSILLDMDC